MIKVLLSTMEATYAMSWGYKYNAGYFFMPSYSKSWNFSAKPYTDTGIGS